MRTNTCISMLGLGLLSMSFMPPGVPETPALSTGIYSVCGCDPTSSTSPVISLTINVDNSFHYMNGTDPQKKVDIAGRWELKGNTVSLFTGTGYVLLEKWTLNKRCLRSKKGMTFTRLCHMEECM
ncbi:MAG: hypothetical protein IPH05_10005 [Flavobacteriales bacterium]|nr:hypothetical protein [Flavobacteriales bacterium]MBK6550772.1 hypothetical protein [Flavobacteriales bacterium]MBK6883258.1 hypothetical protein [Flavobacteriales bacterium]MBK7103403.1 hypothetical protein [Flavobacteriales bacterium]MBK7113989.1 hypothetical protein [Flavobacteriales bacterium]